MAYCGTDQSCEGCPIRPDNTPGAYGTFDYRYDEAEKLGAAAENLHLSGHRSIDDAEARAVVAATGITFLENPEQKLQQALGCLGTPDCQLTE